MNICPSEISPDCRGHRDWWEFADCLTEALYSAGDDGSTGTVDGFGWHVSLFIQEVSETIDAAYDGIKVTIPAGTFCVIRTNDRGHVYRDDYGSAEEVQAAFDDWDSRYGEWLECEDMRELAITSSTGGIGR